MMSPQMVEMMKSMDFNQDKVNAQFKEMGLKPEDVISKVRKKAPVSCSDGRVAAWHSVPSLVAIIRAKCCIHCHCRI